MRPRAVLVSLGLMVFLAPSAAAQPVPPAPPADAAPEPQPNPTPEAAPAPALLPAAPTPPAQPAPPPALAPAAEAAPPLAGWHDVFFVRDKGDHFRFYPRINIYFEFGAFAGPDVSDFPAADGGNALRSRFFLRRIRPELAGEALDRFDFLLGVDFGGQPISNANGKTETTASAAGTNPTADTARFAPVQAPTAAASIANAWINLRVVPELNFMMGQEKAPFSMENRTSDNTHTFMERNLPIRGFVFPTNKEIGITAWGDLAKKLAAYEVGVFGGDGQNRPQVDDRFDFMGRAWVRPFSGSSEVLGKLQIGLSAKHGDRNAKDVGYQYPAITTAGGWALWDPRYKDSLKRQVFVIPSGAQNAIGGELRVPVSRFELKSEAYFVDNHTREALDGYQLTNTERLGGIRGVGWYAELSAWPAGDAFVNGDPGMVRPTRVDFTKPAEIKRGLEVFGLVGGVHASYDGASRGGKYDSKTPGAPGVATRVAIVEYGLGASYWFTGSARATFNYILYQTPGSGSADNLAAVPGNVLATPDTDAHLLHEISARLQLAL